MKVATIEKICKNCDNHFGGACTNHYTYENCQDFVLIPELCELAHESEYDKVEVVAPTVKEEPKPFLTYTGVKNCYTSKPFFKLNQKLTREEWNEVKKYFKYYNFDGLKGWATVNWYDVTKTLVALKVPKYREIKEQIAFHEKEATLYDYDEMVEHTGIAFNLKCDLDKIFKSYYPEKWYL